jgi:hypothetical protein
MLFRCALLVVVLFILANALARLVSVPRFNPVPICILIPALASILSAWFLQWRVRVRYALMAVALGSIVGTFLVAVFAVADYLFKILPGGFYLGRSYWQWDNLVGATWVTSGALVTLAMLARHRERQEHRRKRLGEYRAIV